MKNKYKKYQHQAMLLLVKGKFNVGKNLKQYLAWEHSWKTTSVGLIFIFVTLFLGISITRSSAASVVLVPDGDVTSQWTSLGGTNDATCTAGTHCDYVDENTVDKTTDYIGTGTALGTGIVEEYDMKSQTGIATATQIALRVYAQSATNANGSSLDTISINIRINGTLQTATTCTPAFNTWAACNAVFNGSWTQSNIDSLRVQIVRNVVGSGSPGAQDDDVRIANVYTTLTYTANINYNQSSYRWFANLDTATPATFVNTSGSTASDQTLSHVQTSDGGYVVGGTTSSYTASADAFIAKYNSVGGMQWSRTWGGAGSDTGNAVVQTSDGGYALSGSVGSSDVFLAKYDSSGTLSWSQTWSDVTQDDRVTSMAQTSDGGYILTGNRYDTILDEGYLLLLKFDSAGTLSWAKTMGSAGGASVGNSVVQTSDGGYAVAGDGDGTADALFVKFDSAGNLSWARTWGGVGSDSAWAIIQNTDGSYILSGQTNSFGGGAGDAFVAKYDSSGTLSWSRTWGGTANEIAYNAEATADGGSIITGSSFSYPAAGAGDAFLAKYDSSGTLSWSRTWGGSSGLDQGRSVVQTSDGGYSLAGLTNSYGAGGTDMFLAKYDSSGNISGCSSPMCQTPTPGTSSPSATSGTYSPTVSTASGATATPSPTTTSPTMGSTSQVALSPSTIDVGSPLGNVLQDTAATAPAEGTPFRLRLNIHLSGSQLDASTSQLKLRYALKGVAGSCSAVSSGSYADVTDSTTIRYYDNPNANSGLGLTTNANDPTHSTDTLVRQTYHESGTSLFTNANAIPVGQDGMWDFALIGYHTIQNDRYCFKVTQSNGTDLNTYTSYPELIIPAAIFNQAAYRWYNPEPSGSDITFAKAYGTAASQNDTLMVKTSDGGFATVNNANEGSGNRAYLSKFTSNGTLEWTSELATMVAHDLIQTSDAKYVVVGTASGNTTVSKLNENGGLVWAESWGGVGSDYAEGVTQNLAGNYVVTGYTTSFGAGSGDAVAIVYDSADGGVMQARTWGGTGIEIGNEVEMTSDGGFIITGQTNSYGAGSYDVFLAKYDSSTNLSWSRTWGGTNSEEDFAIKQTSDGGYVVSGETLSFNGFGSYDVFLAKYNSSGTLSWSRTWGDLSDSRAGDVIQATDDGFVITGYTDNFGAGNNDVFLAKYNSSGTLSWSRTWGGSSNDYGSSVGQTTDGGYAVGGTTDSYGSGSSDILLLKYDSSGTISGCETSMCMSPSATSSVVTATVNSPTASSTSPSGRIAVSVSINLANYNTTSIVATLVSVGNPLAPLNSGLDLATLTPLNLRIAVAVDASGIDVNDGSFKLQYALKDSAASCAVVSTGNYVDVSTSGAIAYYDDGLNANGESIMDNVNDPSDGNRTMVPQVYRESNNFTNSQSIVYAGQDGMWQFSLNIDNTSLKGKNFCLRVATSGGSLLTAAHVADVSYAPQMTTMLKNGKWFNRQGYLQPFSL